MSSDLNVDLKKSSTVDLLRAKDNIQVELERRAFAYLKSAGWLEHRGAAVLELTGEEDQENIILSLSGSYLAQIHPGIFDSLAGVEASL